MGIANIIKEIFSNHKIRIGRYKIYLDVNNPHEKQYLNSIVNDDYLISQLIIKEDYNVLDLGANIGFTALLYLKFGAKAVKCFEPVPSLVKRIRSIKSEQISVVEKAIGISVGKAFINLSTSHNQGHSLNNEWPEKFNAVFEGSEEIEIEVTTLDHEIGNEKFDFIKIDVEGNEVDAIKGGKTFFKNNVNSIVQIEIYDWQFEETNSLLRQFFSYAYAPIIKDGRIQELIIINSIEDVKTIKFNSAPNYLYSNRKIQL